MGLIDAVAVPVPVRRSQPSGYDDNGRWVDAGTLEPFTVKAAVQPARPKELLHFPEGQRTREAIKLYSETELRTADIEAGIVADVVTYRGKDYEVKDSGLSEGFGLSVFKAIALRLDPPAGGTGEG